MNLPLYQKLAAQLERRLHADPGFQLRGIEFSAHESGVSYPTMWKAYHELATKGIIRIARGRRSSRARAPEGAGSNMEQTAVDRLCASLRDMIADGTWKTGKPTPKISWLAANFTVSPVTARVALEHLRRENRVHKKGRQWICGPQGMAAGHGAVAAPAGPIVMLIIYSVEHWNYIFASPFLSRFVEPLRDELAAAGFGLRVAGLASQGKLPLPAVPVGIDAIESEILSLGAQYAGTIISITKPDAQELESHIGKLSRFGKPVVYFDSTDEGGAIFAPPARPPSLMYRLHMDEHAAVRMALDALVQRGHTRIGVHAWEYTDWTQRRMEIIEATARALPGAPAIVRSKTPAEQVWGYEGGREAAELFGAHAALDEPRAAAVQPGSGGTSVRRRRLPRTPSLRRLLTDGNPTALLALNDHFAQQYYFRLQAMKVRVPKDISILSFDNLSNAILFPLSTIDFGFSRLGYICAHLLIGDTPPPRTNAGALAGTCTLVDRGSIGAPGDGRRIHALAGGA